MPWVKGQSGNPAGGGPHARAAVQFAIELRAGPAKEALTALVDALGCEDKAVKLVAAKEILARAYGKHPDPKITLADFTDEELVEEIARRNLMRMGPAAQAEARHDA